MSIQTRSKNGNDAIQMNEQNEHSGPVNLTLPEDQLRYFDTLSPSKRTATLRNNNAKNASTSSLGDQQSSRSLRATDNSQPSKPHSISIAPEPNVSEKYKMAFGKEGDKTPSRATQSSRWTESCTSSQHCISASCPEENIVPNQKHSLQSQEVEKARSLHENEKLRDSFNSESQRQRDREPDMPRDDLSLQSGKQSAKEDNCAATQPPHHAPSARSSRQSSHSSRRRNVDTAVNDEPHHTASERSKHSRMSSCVNEQNPTNAAEASRHKAVPERSSCRQEKKSAADEKQHYLTDDMDAQAEAHKTFIHDYLRRKENAFKAKQAKEASEPRRLYPREQVDNAPSATSSTHMRSRHKDDDDDRNERRYRSNNERESRHVHSHRSTFPFEDPRNQYPASHGGAHSHTRKQYQRSEGSIHTVSSAESKHSFEIHNVNTRSAIHKNPGFDASPMRPEDYEREDAMNADDDVHCTFRPNINPYSRRKQAEASSEEGSNEMPVFSRLYADAQRTNKDRAQRERALELKEKMERGEISYDKQALREAGLQVPDTPSSSIGDRPVARTAVKTVENEKKEEGEETAAKPKKRQVDFSVFERLSKPTTVRPKYERAKEMEEQEKKETLLRAEDELKEEMNEISNYTWDLPAKSFKIADLQAQNAVFCA